jgi:hypothetical protein
MTIREEILPVLIVDLASKLKDPKISAWGKEPFAEQLERIRDYCDSELSVYNKNKAKFQRK